MHIQPSGRAEIQSLYPHRPATGQYGCADTALDAGSCPTRASGRAKTQPFYPHRLATGQYGCADTALDAGCCPTQASGRAKTQPFYPHRLATGQYGCTGTVLDAGNAALASRFGHSLGHSGSHSGIESCGEDVVGIQLLRGDNVSDGISSSGLHLIVDVAGTHIQSATEHAREGQNIVDLVGIVAAPVPITAAPPFLASSG